MIINRLLKVALVILSVAYIILEVLKVDLYNDWASALLLLLQKNKYYKQSYYDWSNSCISKCYGEQPIILRRSVTVLSFLCSLQCTPSFLASAIADRRLHYVAHSFFCALALKKLR